MFLQSFQDRLILDGDRFLQQRFHPGPDPLISDVLVGHGVVGTDDLFSYGCLCVTHAQILSKGIKRRIGIVFIMKLSDISESSFLTDESLVT